MKRFGILELISFATGFGLLSFELVAARVLAPTIGSSTYVWTSVIGVIIAALSLGFFFGGKLADRRNHQVDVAWLLLLASFGVMLALLMYSGLLADIAQTELDIRVRAVLAALLLFAPTSFFIGMTSPYLAKLRIESLASTGQSIASLDAMNALGGIAGTFLTGFVLFSYLGSRQTMVLVMLLLLTMSWLLSWRIHTYLRIGVSAAIVGSLLLPTIAARVVEIDTASAHYQIADFRYEDRQARGLVTGPSGIQSAVWLNGPSDPVFWYTQELARITLEKKPNSVLVLGGGTFTLPEYLAEKLPNAQIDVVEIDPELETIAKRYFGYSSPENVKLIFSDARTYINNSTKQYDVVIVDVYGDSMIPFSLLTAEYGRALAARVDSDGLVLANIIGGLSGPCRDVLDAANAAYMQGFRYGSYTMRSDRSARRGNVITLYTNSEQYYGLRPIPRYGEAYSDDFAPSERLYFACESSH